MTTDHEKFDADKRLRMAVLELRTRLSLTQTQFGQSLGKSLNSIQRWETVTPPKANALAKLVRLATLKKQADLAETFRLALSAEVGIDVHLSPMALGYEFEPEHRVIADAFFEMVHAPEKWKHIQEAVERDLGPVIANLASRVVDDDDGSDVDEDDGGPQVPIIARGDSKQANVKRTFRRSKKSPKAKS